MAYINYLNLIAYMLIEGALYMISLPDFYRYVMSWSAVTAVPNTRGEYPTWDHLLHNEYGVFEIHQ